MKPVMVIVTVHFNYVRSCLFDKQKKKKDKIPAKYKITFYVIYMEIKDSHLFVIVWKKDKISRTNENVIFGLVCRRYKYLDLISSINVNGDDSKIYDIYD